MAYNGILIKVGNYNIDPKKWIQADSYSALYSITDVDAYRNANGELVRNALEHRVAKIEFNTIANLSNTEFAELMSNISKNYTIAKERKANVTCYVPEIDGYITTEMYMPDINPKIYRIDEDNHTIYYEAIRLAFIGY